MYRVIEKPKKKDEKRPFATWTYEMKNLKRESVESFWDYLVEQGVIESYEIEEL